MLGEKRIKLFDIINRLIPEDKKVHLSFSNGWFQKILKRLGLRSHNSNGERGSANNAAIARELPALPEHLRKYAPKDIFNADKFGLYWRMTPDRAIAKK